MKSINKTPMEEILSFEIFLDFISFKDEAILMYEVYLIVLA